MVWVFYFPLWENVKIFFHVVFYFPDVTYFRPATYNEVIETVAFLQVYHFAGHRLQSCSRLHLLHFVLDIFSFGFGLTVFLKFASFVRNSPTFFVRLSSIYLLICSEELLAISKTLSSFKSGVSWRCSDNPLSWSPIICHLFLRSCHQS